MERECACGCGKDLAGKSKHARFYNRACQARAYKQAHPRAVIERPFVALDGEGINSNYVLLACGNGTYIQRRNGLSTQDCLRYLVSLPRGKKGNVKPIYTWFAFDYDVNMMLRDIPFTGENSIEQLRATNEITWHGFKIRYIRRKILRIRYGNLLHTSYDVWGFFQGSFESSLEKWGIASTARIIEGKAARKDFSKWSLKRIREYNEDELTLLEKLCEALRDSVTPLELPIQSWHGPAALAASWLRKQKVKEWISEPPTEMEDACVRAYFGGRIDVAGYGYCHPVYHYDIVSAYPSAIRNLPNLSKVNWKNARKTPPRGSTFVARIRWEIPTTKWGCFPWRDKHGTIFWPPAGEGWYWNYELEAALEKWPASCFEILDSWVAEGELEYPFRSLIEEAFQYRAELKAQGHPSHVAVKLILNSLYGKFAQTVGQARYYSAIWAGMITAQTRAELLRRITDSTVLVMTDSLWSTEPLDVPIGKQLGEWEAQGENELWIAGAGLYEAREDGGESFQWQRGFDKANPVDIRNVVETWLYEDDFYEPVYDVNRFIGYGLALQTHYPWRTWQTLQRRIQPLALAGTSKRQPIYPLYAEDSYQFGATSFVELLARSVPANTLSAPYSKIVLQPEKEFQMERLQDECEE